MSSPYESAREAARERLEPLLDQPLTQRMLSEASTIRDRVLRTQESVLGAAGVPTAADFAKLERRLRGLTDSVAAIDDRLDRIESLLKERS